MGRGTMISKVDIKSAYRLTLIHPEDRMLLACWWRSKVLVDSALPFGLQSAPKIFNAVADVIAWCFWKEGVVWVDHYMDDFIGLGTTGTEECAEGSSHAPTAFSPPSDGHGPPGRSGDGLGLSQLDSALQMYCSLGIAASTKRTYDSPLRQYKGFCAWFGIRNLFLF
uniref:Reverse transcriptase domain-containing protein n=1 Tax=Amphimedon queenslandica TaxID=400682 RepID=A0A1X7UUA9_AMPQE